jgi:SAM-dependent methyltransferase
MPTPGRVDAFLSILRDLDIPITESTRVLDLGCGAGRVVQDARRKGLQFYGCGFALRDDDQTAAPELVGAEILRTINRSSYVLPFEDCFFDVVISDQVFEHVMDYPTTLREMHRVLKPGGWFLHMFPSRYGLIEPHVLVPFGAMVQARWWLMCWALIGIRNRFQKGLSASETCTANKTFLTTRTNYLSKRALRRLFAQYYTDIDFVEHLFLKQSKRGHKAHELSTWLPFLPKLYSALRGRVLVGKRPDISSERADPMASVAGH